MTLISMLLALIIERLAVRSDAWQARPYCQAYVKLTNGTVLAKLAEHTIGRYLWLLLPGILVTLLLCLVDNRLFTLIINTLVLLVGIGCWHYRQLYKQYLNALDRGDEEAAFLSMQQIRHDSRSSVIDTDGLLLVWLNFRYYAAVVFWFLVLGPFGVITYALVRHINEQPDFEQATSASQQDDTTVLDETETAHYEAQAAEATDFASDASVEQDAVFTQPEAGTKPKDAVHYLLHWADFFPARLFGLGFALVGYFSRASNALLGYFLDFSANNQQVITDVAKAAEPVIEPMVQTDLTKPIDDTAAMVQLAKRNMLFFLAFTAILTLSGWLG